MSLENWPASHRARTVLSFALFAAAALLILCWPVGDPTLNVAAWLGCLGCLVVMRRITNSVRDNAPFVFTNYVLFLFILFFLTERFLRYVVEWSQAEYPQVQWLHTQWLMHRPPGVQMVSSVIVGMCAAFVLPHLRGLIEGSTIAREEHSKFLAAAESSMDDFYIFDGIPDDTGKIIDFRFTYINPSAERRLGTRRDSLLGKVLTEERPFMIASGLIEKYQEVVRTGEPYTCEVYLDDEMIKATWISVQVVKLGTGIAITSRDVTERKRLADHVNFLAHHDSLTGLPNRMLLMDRLHRAILRAQRHKQKVAVFMLDIDHFKSINDSLGHADGDALLVAVAKRLSGSVRETDTIARMGGDEFVVVMPEFNSLEEVRMCGELLVHTAAQPVRIGEREIKITVSVGLCIFPDYGSTEDELLKNADAAMYAVKATGRNGLNVYSAGVVGKSKGA